MSLSASPDEPLIHGDGNAESDWAGCRWLHDMATVSLAALMSDRGRLVVVAPHPDDEVLGCGGLMWTAHRAGIEVVVVSVTQGEACYPGHDAETLARQRHAELVAAMTALGLPAHRLLSLDIADGGVTAAEARLGRALLGVVGPGDLVVATWEHDGHPDHESAGRAARRAAALAGARYAAYPVWAWHWLDVVHGRCRFDGGARFTLSADAQAAKRAAIACFGSQLEAPDGHAPILPAHVTARFARPFEVFLP